MKRATKRSFLLTLNIVRMHLTMHAAAVSFLAKMSRAQRAAAALNDRKGLFGEEDSSALEEVALDWTNSRLRGHGRVQRG